MITIEEIVDFTKDFLKEDNIFPDTDIFSLGIYGDDMDEFLGSYHKKYGVNFDNYLWYFHNEEEISNNFSIGKIFFKPPYDSVERIPITPEILTKFANTKVWEIYYPEHQLPKYRYDVLIDQIIFGGLALIIIYISLKDCFGRN
ncbi:DUF1493 family protein [Cloacibacterium caeni]|uniref:DUF1493 family protein n=1 Tax=Cloacibacterium caeni TaxID=2004710 RepID=UPI001BCE1A00|nr:DUF1493 family protein [Cloacibacterium caeni]